MTDKTSRRRYFKSAEELRYKIRNPELAKYDLAHEQEEVDREREETDEQLRRLELLESRWGAFIPFGTPTNPRRCVVYILKVDDIVKIGIATAGDNRLRALRNTLDMSELQLLCTTPGARVQLSKLHRRFDHLRISGEWFRAADELFAFAKLARLEAEEQLADDVDD